MKNHWVTRAATLGLMAGMISLPLAAIATEEMTVETPKVYTPAKVNGVDGYWVEFQKKIYKKVAKVKNSGKVGWFDQSLQDLYSEYFGMETPLSEEQLRTLYNKYGIPQGWPNDRNYGNGLHDFAFKPILDQLKSDLATAQRLASAQTVAEIVDAMGVGGLRDAIYGVASDAAQRWGGNANYPFDNSVYGRHVLNYDHKADGYPNTANYIDYDKLDSAAFNRNANRSIRDILENHTSDFKSLGNSVSTISSMANAGRFYALANMNLPLPVDINVKVLSANGPISINENLTGNWGGLSNTNAWSSTNRLKEVSRFLYGVQWETHSPVALDLNHDGKIGVTGVSTAQRRMQGSGFVMANSVWFDITGTGKKMNIEWLDKSGDGFLVDDSNGRITKALASGGELDGNFLFGDAIGYTHGYHKLAVKKVQLHLASNFHGDDNTAWSKLIPKKPSLKGDILNTMKVWVDKNQDAKAQAGEVLSLASLGITEVGATPMTTKNAKGEYLIQSYFVQNGKKHLTEDVWFAENPATVEKK